MSITKFMAFKLILVAVNFRCNSHYKIFQGQDVSKSSWQRCSRENYVAAGLIWPCASRFTCPGSLITL